MSTFSKLSLVAQYDDMCRLVNKIIKDSTEEENTSIKMLETLGKRYKARVAEHEREKDNLRGEIAGLQKEVRKLNRQLAESRQALVREADEKKSVAREKKALMEQIRQVRQLVEKENYGDTDRRRVMKCLDVERLSPIQSDDSDDCVSGLDYDRTEEDILDTAADRSRRSTNHFEEALENLASNEQPTLLCRYLDKQENDNAQEQDYNNHGHEPRRTTRLQTQQRRSAQSSSNPTSASTGNNGMADLNLDTDVNSMDTDDNDIEYVRQQLQQYEADKREKLASANSTPNIKEPKRSATLTAKSAANLMKSISSVSTPVSNALKPHSFVSKKSFKPENCVPCGGKVGFYGDCVKCEICGVISHPDCKEKCPLPCVKITAPNTRSRQKKILISDYVNSDAVPKVPALIVHCCNEIEKEENITNPGLYRVVAHTKDIEELQQKILKSKSGMPNLSKVDVHILTGVVKRFLQSLDESLLTTTLWSHFSEAIKLDSDIEAKTHMSYYISYDLPSANRDTLAYLMQHLHAIAKRSNENNMTMKNLAKTLAPTIVGNSCRNPAQTTILNETKIQIQIMETLFAIDEDYWVKIVPRASQADTHATGSLGSRLLAETPSGRPRTRGSRLGETLPTPKLKPLFG